MFMFHCEMNGDEDSRCICIYRQLAIIIIVSFETKDIQGSSLILKTPRVYRNRSENLASSPAPLLPCPQATPSLSMLHSKKMCATLKNLEWPGDKATPFACAVEERAWHRYLIYTSFAHVSKYVNFSVRHLSTRGSKKIDCKLQCRAAERAISNP